MTPREKLVNDYSEKFGGNAGFEVLRDMENNMEQLLEPYAIGKWVPVSERLPERDARGNWTGIVKCRDGEVAPVIFNQKNTPAAVFTHWLELDMPEIGE